jgi:hypothetical protein
MEAGSAHVFVHQQLVVTSATATSTGFSANFNRNLDASTLNLYDVQGQPEPADVTLVGDTVGAVRGSLVVDPGLRKVTFVCTGGVLQPDTYTVTLRGGANGFQDAAGHPLDGNRDGTPDDDFVDTFTVAPEPVVVGLPDFTRGPGQQVDVPADGNGLLLTLSDARTGGNGIESVVVKIRYDPALLNITAAEPGPDAPGGAMVLADTGTPGLLTLSYSSPGAPLADGTFQFVRLIANVPASANYNSSYLLDLYDLQVTDSAAAMVPATADDALHQVAYFGDATGNEDYSGLDAQRVARVTVGLDTGFDAYPTIDPLIVGDVTGNGAFSGLDAQRIAQMAVSLNPVEIPPLPQPLRLARLPAVGHGVGTLTDSQLTRVVKAAAVRIGGRHDDDPTVPEQVTFAIVDLPGNLLGVAHGGTVQIDVDAAGYGWFIDTTSRGELQFPTSCSPGERCASPGSLAYGHADLLTVVLHELGHILGYGHEDEGIMCNTLPLGTRRLLLDAFDESPDAGDCGTAALDRAFASVV